MKTHALALAGMILLSGSAVAQESQQIDPRLAGPAMAAMRAQRALLDAMLKTTIEDAQKREAEWAEYAKPLWQAPAPAKGK